MAIYYRNKSTGKIEAIYVDCDTNSSKFRDENKYTRFEDSRMLPLEVQPSPDPPRLNTKLEDLLIAKGVVSQKEVDGLKTVSVVEAL